VFERRTTNNRDPAIAGLDRFLACRKCHAHSAKLELEAPMMAIAMVLASERWSSLAV
jgi:hypothetical protein